MAKKAKPKAKQQKPLKKRPNDLLIAVYQAVGQRICTLKKRHMVLLGALVISHVYLLSNGQTVLRNGVTAWDGEMLWAHVGIALFLGLVMWHGCYAMRDARVRMRRCNADLIGRDPGLGSLLSANPSEDDRGDILMFLSALYAPLFSIAIVLKEIDPNWMIKIACLAAVFTLLDVILQKSPKFRPPTFFAISLAILVVEVWYIYLLS